MTQVAISRLKPHPRNPRMGDVDAIAKSLEVHGQYRPIVAQKSTGHVLAGNHTLKAAKSLGWKSIDVVWSDVDDAEALRILLVDNRTGQLGGFDDEQLASALAELSASDEGLAGTAYEMADLRVLQRRLDPPPVDAADVTGLWAVVIECADESAQVALLERFIAEGLDAKALVG